MRQHDKIKIKTKPKTTNTMEDKTKIKQGGEQKHIHDNERERNMKTKNKKRIKTDSTINEIKKKKHFFFFEKTIWNELLMLLVRGEKVDSTFPMMCTLAGHPRSTTLSKETSSSPSPAKADMYLKHNPHPPLNSPSHHCKGGNTFVFTSYNFLSSVYGDIIFGEPQKLMWMPRDSNFDFF